MLSHNITHFPPGWSLYGEVIDLQDADERAFFQSRLGDYQDLASMDPQPVQAPVLNNTCLTLLPVLQPHSVLLYELQA